MTDAEDPGEGARIELTVGAVAHGGHCVARIGGTGGRVVFVRHALPGERVLAEVTEVRPGYLRADAVAVLAASPDRVEPPCPWARPGACGGCDLQHVARDAQLRWKAAVVREQLERLAGLPPEQVEKLAVRVAALPGPPLGWRSRVRYAVDATGTAGLFRHRSYEVVPVDRCRIAHPAIQQLPVLGRPWPDDDAVEVIASSAGDVIVRAGGSAGPAVRELALGRAWSLDPRAFWQVHPAAPDTLADAVLRLLEPAVGETAWDLYGGAGLFAAALADRVGITGAVTVVESSGLAVAAARANLADLPQVRVVPAQVEVALRRRLVRGPVDLMVLDPPRAGAGAAVARALAGCGARAIAYVACDPAALARDVRAFAGRGWRLAGLLAYDCFPMTQHVECVALLLPPSAGQAPASAGLAPPPPAGRA
jgi:tRNA/tmRNA/rRNA uracil-C5-methylase (TrmA/RlmC/RlmD family)